jgi:multidomain signaling protein FimX
VATKSPDKRILRLLIVDDSPDDADLLSKNLRIARFMLKTDRVINASAMQTALQKGKWDAVVCDSNLINLNCQLALDTVKRIDPSIPFIVFASKMGDDEMVGIMRAGARDVILKSHPARIIPAIERELDVATARNETRRVTELIREMENKHKAMIEGAKDAVCYCHEGMHIDTNQMYLDMFGYESLQELEIIPVMDLIDKEDHERFKRVLRKASKNKEITESTEFTCKKRDGGQLHIELSIATVNHKGENCLQLAVKDITKRKAAENRLKYLSQRDPLTGLYNRHHFMKMLSDLIEEIKAGANPAVLIYLDLYDLKDINAELGYTAGDRLLLKITKMFRETLASDITIARVGGDEFTVLLENAGLKEGRTTTDKIKELFQKTLLSEKGKKHECNCATSITMINDKSGTAQDIITKAGIECDQERPQSVIAAKPAAAKPAAPKPADKKPAAQPEPAESKPAAAKPAAPKPARAPQASPWTKRIQEALKNNRFKLVYQPIISLHGESSEYFEVLVRMLDENDNMIPPGNFLAAAENSGQIKDIDYWVTEHATESLASLHAEGREARFFINLSMSTCRDKNYMNWVKKSLDNANIDGRFLIFELEESDLLNNSEEDNKKIVENLTSLGSTVSIDNCGLSLDSVLNLPKQSIAFIKIPNATVESASANIDKKESLTAMLAMAVKLEVNSVAKAIEDAHSLTELWTFGFEYVQGNYFQQADEEITYDFTPEDEAELSSEDIQQSTWTQ